MSESKRHIACETRGSALVFALGILVIFVTIGTIYVREMNLELERANFGMAKTRARMAAQAGINAALADMQVAVRSGKVWDLVGRTQEYSLPVYKQERTESGLELMEDDRRIAMAQVVIADESGKLNINHASVGNLALALGVDEAVALKIKALLPRGNAELDAQHNRKWFYELEELVERELLTPEELAKVDRSLVTTYSVANHNAPEHHLNINTAPVGVLATFLGLDQAAAEKLAVQRPFVDIQALASALGKEPAALDEYAEVISFESRCFLLKSEAHQARVTAGREDQRVSAYAEALVLFDDTGAWKTLAWSAQQSLDDI